MARGIIQVLTGEEMDRIHATSTRVLKEVGVAVHSPDVCDMLVGFGCARSGDGKRILFPEEVVKMAVASGTMKPVLLAARDPKYDIVAPSNQRVRMTCGGEGVYVKNMLTGDTHPATLDDLIDFTILCEKTPQTDFVWGMVGATEQPPFIKEIVEMRAIFENTTKHFQGGSLSAEQARRMIDIGSVLAGGRGELEKRPLFSAIQCPLSPLTFERGVIEAQVELARAGIPVVAMSAPIAGISSPITLSGTIAQTTAENLASLVVSQAAKKGAPFIFSSDSSPADMKTGSIDYGGIEAPLMHAGCGQMGRYYGLPTMVSGATMQEASLMLGTAQEGIPLMLTEALIDSDIGTGFGGIDNALGASLEQFVADAWVWDIAREFARDFDSDDSAISYETIRSVVNGGAYLSQPHTIRRFRKENLASRRPEAGSPERDRVEPRGTLIKKARVEAERILSQPRESCITIDEAKDLDELFRKIGIDSGSG